MSLFIDLFDSLHVVPPCHLFTHGLAGGEPDDGRQVDDCIRLPPFPAQGILNGARLCHIGFDKMEIGMVQERQQRLAAEQQAVDHGHVEIGPEQFGGQERSDIARASRDQDMTFLCHI